MELVFKGKVEHIGEFKKTDSYSAIDFVLVEAEPEKPEYPEKAVFTAFGERAVEFTQKYKAGDVIYVSYHCNAREYNGRWYNSLRVWRFGSGIANNAEEIINSVTPVERVETPVVATDTEEDLPF